MHFICHAVLAAALLWGGSLAAAEAEAIFNGRDLSGWEGKPHLWSVRDGAICGESSLAHPVFSNTFLIWKGGTVKDFELRLKVRLANGNSGVQYRSRDLGRWVVAGYQAEVANEPGTAGFLYEEKGRKFLAYLGEAVRIETGGARGVYGSLGAKNDYLGWKYYRAGEWNDYLILAQGSYLAHYVNGFKTIELVDEDAARRAAEGVLALQIHAGLPMKVEYKDLLLKAL
jgi:hypothetical protein